MFQLNLFVNELDAYLNKFLVHIYRSLKVPVCLGLNPIWNSSEKDAILLLLVPQGTVVQVD